jgi:hypothetical protein
MGSCVGCVFDRNLKTLASITCFFVLVESFGSLEVNVCMARARPAHWRTKQARAHAKNKKVSAALRKSILPTTRCRLFSLSLLFHGQNRYSQLPVFSASTSGTSDFYEQTQQGPSLSRPRSKLCNPDLLSFSIRDCRSKFLRLLILACWQRGRGYVNKWFTIRFPSLSPL